MTRPKLERSVPDEGPEAGAPYSTPPSETYIPGSLIGDAVMFEPPSASELQARQKLTAVSSTQVNPNRRRHPVSRDAFPIDPHMQRRLELRARQAQKDQEESELSS